jgi:hypothetical protein
MIAINCEYDSFRHVHLDTILQRDYCSVRAVKIIETFVDRGVKIEATGSGKIYSPFQFSIFWRKMYWWECA